MAGNPDEWTEVITQDAFGGTLPATVPVHWGGDDGPVIGQANITRAEDGLAVSMHIGPPEVS